MSLGLFTDRVQPDRGRGGATAAGGIGRKGGLELRRHDKAGSEWRTDRVLQHVRLFAMLTAAAALGACGSISEKLSGQAAGLPGVGLPADAPQRPDTKLSYPAVHDMPPPRSANLLNEVEQQKIEDDLVAARERQQAAAGIARPAAPARKRTAPASAPAARDIPAPSSRTIY